MDRSRTQSKERTQRSRPSSRTGQPSSHSSAAPPSVSEGRHTRTQSPVAGPSARGNSPVQAGPSQPQQPSGTAPNDGDEGAWDLHNSLQELAGGLRRRQMLLTQFNSIAEQENEISEMDNQVMDCIVQKKDLDGRWQRLISKGPVKLDNGPGGGPPGPREFNRYQTLCDDHEADKQAMRKELEEIKAVFVGITTRVVNLHLAAVGEVHERDRRQEEERRELQAQIDRNEAEEFAKQVRCLFTSVFRIV